MQTLKRRSNYSLISHEFCGTFENASRTVVHVCYEIRSRYIFQYSSFMFPRCSEILVLRLLIRATDINRWVTQGVGIGPDRIVHS